MAAYATLDSTQKQCSEHLIDGEELRNRLVSPSGSQHCSIAFVCPSRVNPSGMAELLSPAPNLGTDCIPAPGLLHLQDCLLAHEDEQLPLAGHVVGIL